MSTAWRAEYSAALRCRDQHEQASRALIDAYTKLADRTSSSPSQHTTTSTNDDATLTDLRADLAHSQTARTTQQALLTSQTTALTALQAQTATQTRQLSTLALERATLLRRLSDRDAELRAKKKLLEEVQDEMLSLNLQLNVAEEKKGQLEVENAELVRRWMERVEREVEGLHERSRYS